MHEDGSQRLVIVAVELRATLYSLSKTHTHPHTSELC